MHITNRPIGTPRMQIPSAKSWEEQKFRLKVRFPKLTDEDLNFEPKQQAEMFLRLEFKLALTRQEIQAIAGS